MGGERPSSLNPALVFFSMSDSRRSTAHKRVTDALAASRVFGHAWSPGRVLLGGVWFERSKLPRRGRSQPECKGQWLLLRKGDGG